MNCLLFYQFCETSCFQSRVDRISFPLTLYFSCSIIKLNSKVKQCCDAFITSKQIVTSMKKEEIHYLTKHNIETSTNQTKQNNGWRRNNIGVHTNMGCGSCLQCHCSHFSCCRTPSSLPRQGNSIPSLLTLTSLLFMLSDVVVTVCVFRCWRRTTRNLYSRPYRRLKKSLCCWVSFHCYSLSSRTVFPNSVYLNNLQLNGCLARKTNTMLNNLIITALPRYSS